MSWLIYFERLYTNIKHWAVEQLEPKNDVCTQGRLRPAWGSALMSALIRVFMWCICHFVSFAEFLLNCHSCFGNGYLYRFYCFNMCLMKRNIVWEFDEYLPLHVDIGTNVRKCLLVKRADFFKFAIFPSNSHITFSFANKTNKHSMLTADEIK